MSKMDDMLHDDKLPPGQVKLVSQMLEVLQNGTQVRSFFLILFLFRASEARISDVGGAAKWDTGTQFTCFTGTKVQLPTQKAMLGAQFVCFTGTKVQILTQKLCAGRQTCGCFGLDFAINALTSC